MSDTGQTRSRRGLTIDVATELGDLLLDLSHDKKTRAQIGRLIKEAKPDSQHAAAFKDIELEDRLTAFEKQQEDRAIEEQRKAAIARVTAQRQRLLDGGEDGGGRKYSEDDIKKIEALMERKGISDYEDGATLYGATVPQPGPLEEEPAGTSNWEFPEWAAYKDDPIQASKNRAREVIRDLNNRRK